MAGKIRINSERCKGCGLCVVVCPRKSIGISKGTNRAGYFPAEWKDGVCTACGMCAIVCPDAAIEVYRDEKGGEVVEIRPKGKKGAVSAKEAR